MNYIRAPPYFFNVYIQNGSQRHCSSSAVRLVIPWRARICVTWKVCAGSGSCACTGLWTRVLRSPQGVPAVLLNVKSFCCSRPSRTPQSTHHADPRAYRVRQRLPLHASPSPRSRYRARRVRPCAAAEALPLERVEETPDQIQRAH